MANSNYCVVEFIGSKELATVPSSWISEEICTLVCAWPPGKRASKLAKVDAPVHSSWIKYPCEILHTSPTYAAAIKKERLLESDLEEIPEQHEGLRKKQRKNYALIEQGEESFDVVSELFGSEDNIALPDVSSSVSQEEYNSEFCGTEKQLGRQFSSFGKSARTRGKQRKGCMSLKTKQETLYPLPPVIIEVAGSTNAVALPDVSSSINLYDEELSSSESVNDHDILGRLERLEKCCASIQKDVRQILDLLQARKNDQVTLVEKLDVVENYLPLTNLPALYELESQLADRFERREELRIHLQHLGGSSTDEMVKKMLRHIFTDDLAQHFSWFGHKGKYKLCDLFVMKCIFQAVRTSEVKGTREQIEYRIKEWFRQASTRNKNLIENRCRA